MGKILDKITSPGEVKELSNVELEVLAGEIREFLIDSVSKTGGHLASNLGVVELTISLFKSFNLEKDKIVWDVGHQSYVHKILTGRKDQFNNLRKYNGLSGFPKRCESKYDAFDTGHSSTSISAALGMARARDIKNEDNQVVAVIGDGALTGGMALEALNDVGFKKTKMIVILNDNQMSISPNVGGLSTHLNNLRMEPRYNKLKSNINETLSNSNAGKKLASCISRFKDSIKQFVVPSMLFEDMGLKYIGPINGHDIETMTEVLEKAKQIDEPVIIHVVTSKGKGYELAEKNPNKFHGVSPFDLESGEAYIPSERSYSKVFGDAMLDLAKEDERIVAITAAMPDGTGLKGFAKEFPNRFFDVGIAEAHATTLAAGLASANLKPVFAVYSTFLQRAFDQLIHDVCIQNMPVIFAIDRAGLVGEDGETHQGMFDLSYLSQVPNMTVLAPKHLNEIKVMLKWAFTQNGPVAIRYPRGTDCCNEMNPLTEISYGKWERIITGEKIAIIAVGKMLQHALLAKEILKSNGINPTIINATFVKPLDKNMLENLVKEGYDIVTIEDNIINGGFGSYVLMKLYELGFRNKFKALGFKDKFVPQGNVDLLYKENKLDPEGIAEAIIELNK
ncbi:1-deoxy-D-xylulose-5-phosphate synthase [Clostridium tertium]|jgi:1-deoxy-D-xylulose-5-phosphate synthase|uniref:1-deoxy-D-xylulose-5-phosphate synthase n=1 Tax=Clostridium TaxID=1485 RepID=UPI00019B03EB|nr:MULTISPECIES: 1-deoxy-D-xylulose-5-phosphate synthase [Clostridium]EEH97685.1 1-deoxy-D-xylulose-5-phosphate synthase [Clostridium sp. 7_2_43FAA]MDB1923331.1 1-deoxy-D-xylulose-5-phosphate synthase [Clostridium tertium]MDB1927014.1 1-deoxy-D-xylulose-5-phosphate synthase [Clostridium tertium]MDB1929936.1 1-deoxy-D-xylulose-5-phosphate synthase [Clostridium tertium]MDB1956296.1 1-deoxy-D-xylulose-5-phosphate synthase [Clostridium tertium]